VLETFTEKPVLAGEQGDGPGVVEGEGRSLRKRKMIRIC
jgi:hypothetical protein